MDDGKCEMMRSYGFTWYPKKDAKYKEPEYRYNVIQLSKPTGETSIDAKRALNTFISIFGNLNKNEIVSIKEFGENGQIGEDIVPTGDNAIVPTVK